MIRISNNPIPIPRMPFGKNNGLLFSEMPTEYLECLMTTDLDEDMAYTEKKHLERVPGE